MSKRLFNWNWNFLSHSRLFLSFCINSISLMMRNIFKAQKKHFFIRFCLVCISFHSIIHGTSREPQLDITENFFFIFTCKFIQIKEKEIKKCFNLPMALTGPKTVLSSTVEQFQRRCWNWCWHSCEWIKKEIKKGFKKSLN